MDPITSESAVAGVGRQQELYYKLDDVGKTVWGHIMGHYPNVVLTQLDGPKVFDVCDSFSQLMKLFKLLDDDPLNSEIMKATAAAQERFSVLSDRYGMTPLSRARIESENKTKPENQNPCDQ